jgi:hypothetical protein
VRICKKNDLLSDRWQKLCNFSVEKGRRIRYNIDKPTEEVEEVEPGDEGEEQQPQTSATRKN